MSTSENVETAKNGYAAFAEADLEAVLGIFDDDIEFVVPGTSAVSGTYRGKAEVTEFFAKVAEQSFTTTPSRFIADDDVVVVLTQVTAGGIRTPSRCDHLPRRQSRQSPELRRHCAAGTGLRHKVVGRRTQTGHGVTSGTGMSGVGMTSELASFSMDLVSRWTGALFALNPTNPDAARHFCTSAREVLTSILDIAAPDSAVLEASPNCELTPQGTLVAVPRSAPAVPKRCFGHHCGRFHRSGHRQRVVAVRGGDERTAWRGVRHWSAVGAAYTCGVVNRLPAQHHLARSSTARVYWEDGAVLVEQAMLAHIVDRRSLAHAGQSVAAVANDIGGMIAAVFGGQTPVSEVG